MLSANDGFLAEKIDIDVTVTVTVTVIKLAKGIYFFSLLDHTSPEAFMPRCDTLCATSTSISFHKAMMMTNKPTMSKPSCNYSQP